MKRRWTVCVPVQAFSLLLMAAPVLAEEAGLAAGAPGVSLKEAAMSAWVDSPPPAKATGRTMAMPLSKAPRMSL